MNLNEKKIGEFMREVLSHWIYPGDPKGPISFKLIELTERTLLRLKPASLDLTLGLYDIMTYVDVYVLHNSDIHQLEHQYDYEIHKNDEIFVFDTNIDINESKEGREANESLLKQIDVNDSAVIALIKEIRDKMVLYSVILAVPKRFKTYTYYKKFLDVISKQCDYHLCDWNNSCIVKSEEEV